jgi:hypothetical protein
LALGKESENILAITHYIDQNYIEEFWTNYNMYYSLIEAPETLSQGFDNISTELYADDFKW